MICFPNSLYSHTRDINSILSIGSCFCGKIGLWSIEITKVVCGLLRPPRVVIFFALSLWVSLLCRGDCGGVWVCRYPSKCKGDCVGVLALCLSL